MDSEREGTEVVKHEDVAAVMETGGRFDLADVGDPTAGLETARKLVSYMAKKCTGPEYIAQIQGRKYPKVDWWTTVGGGLGLFPREESCRKLDRPNETVYEATVGVYNGDQLVTRASAICSDKESTWSGRDEYAIKSMAITRATGKAYRVGLSFLPVMAGLEPTPAEEMPQNGGGREGEHTCIDLDETLGFGKHGEKTWREVARDNPGYIGWLKKEGTDRLCEDDYDKLRPIARPEAGGESGEESGEGASASPAQQWITLYERHRDPSHKKRRTWETRVLTDALENVPLDDDGLVDHNELTAEEYELLADLLMAEIDEASQEALPV